MRTTRSLLSVVFWALSACTSPSPSPDTHSADVNGTTLLSTPARVASTSSVLERSEIKMGMPFKIKLYGVTNTSHAREAINAAFEAITVVENKMSEWKASSEVSRINQSAGQARVLVSPMTFEVLQTAHTLATRSQGAFDPTWAAFRGIWSFKSHHPKLPSPTSIETALTLVNYRDLELRQPTRSAFLKKKGMELGLGGIAKGYGIDQAAKVLKQRNYDQFMIDGGGDILVGASFNEHSPLRIGITHPRISKRIFATVTAQNEAVVTSGDYEHYFEIDGQRYHHIIDVRTGYPASKAVSVTVVSPSAMIADALATALFVLGPSKFSELLAHYPKTKALMLAADGAVYGFPQKFADTFPKRWRPDASPGTQ